MALSYRDLTDFLLVSIVVLVVYLFLRRMHRSPWGRALQTVRADEELAEALGKNAYVLNKMQAFVLGSVLMDVAGFYAYQFLYVSPSELEPINTFYVWVAVILGDTGSNCGTFLGGLTIVLVREGPRFVNDAGLLPVNSAAFRLLLVGLFIVLIVRFRSEGILPPRTELIWPAAREMNSEGATAADGGDVS